MWQMEVVEKMMPVKEKLAVSDFTALHGISRMRNSLPDLPHSAVVRILKFLILIKATLNT